jgi:hypothetical protein
MHYAEEYHLEYYTAKSGSGKGKSASSRPPWTAWHRRSAKISVTYLIQDQEEWSASWPKRSRIQIPENARITFNVQIVTRKQRFLQVGQTDYELVYFRMGSRFRRSSHLHRNLGQ